MYACMYTTLKHMENIIFTFMPFQAYKKNHAPLQSIGVRMLQENAEKTWKYQHVHIPIPSPASTHQQAVASQQSPATCHQVATFQDPVLRALC